MFGFRGYRNWSIKDFNLSYLQSGFYAFGGMPGYTRFDNNVAPPPCGLCNKSPSANEPLFGGMAYSFFERSGASYVRISPNCLFCALCELRSSTIVAVLRERVVLYSSSQTWRALLNDSSPSARFYNGGALHILPLDRKPWLAATLGQDNFLAEVRRMEASITEGRLNGSIVDCSNDPADSAHHLLCKKVLTPKGTLVFLNDARAYCDFIESWERQIRSETGPSSRDKRKEL